ncbi:uncharacterized protein LOC121881008 isoform X6 [Thunnus maccoyii]|uniref:uncharacterized protein LOC121881008 isoform X6 n=1 Tax=Thunnus maccoyii TaxID=8240 RepID=UPI001C4BD590|nr:uncharacterized protein LOC121881008 isoform X6 [Thunnus maccoyii]
MPRPLVMPLILKKKREMNRKKSQGTLPPQGLSSRWHHDYQPAEDSASSQQQLEQRQLQLRVQGLSSRWHHDYQPAEDSASSQQQLEQRQLQLRVQGGFKSWTQKKENEMSLISVSQHTITNTSVLCIHHGFPETCSGNKFCSYCNFTVSNRGQ